MTKTYIFLLKFWAMVEVCSFNIEDLADNLVKPCQDTIKNNSYN